MNYCDVCYDRPQPMEFQVRLHFVEVDLRRKVWFSGDRALYTVTVYNRSSLPMERVVLSSGGAAFLDGSVRVNGLSEPEADPVRGIEIPGLDAGGRVLVTWEEELRPGQALTERPVRAEYAYRFDGRLRFGETEG